MNNNLRIGFAKDIHKLIKDKNRKLVLGGLEFSDEYWKIKAHSDGDIIIHSLCSAILGACDEKTLGEWFSDTDEKNKNRSSIEFLSLIVKNLKFKLISIDICIVCEHIMFKDKIDLIKKNMKKILNYDGHLNVKATRFEDKKRKYIEVYSNLILELV